MSLRQDPIFLLARLSPLCAPEILREILRHVEKGSLPACVRVSRRFYELAGLWLYRELHIRNDGNRPATLLGADTPTKVRATRSSPVSINFKLALLAKTKVLELSWEDECRNEISIESGSFPALRTLRLIFNCDTSRRTGSHASLRGTKVASNDSELPVAFDPKRMKVVFSGVLPGFSNGAVPPLHLSDLSLQADTVTFVIPLNSFFVVFASCYTKPAARSRPQCQDRPTAIEASEHRVVLLTTCLSDERDQLPYNDLRESANEVRNLLHRRGPGI